MESDDREVDGGQSQRANSESSNVVRFPREWLGPPEELVPFGPRAPETGAERADPPSFWDEDSAMLQAVVAGPGEGAAGDDSSEVARPPDAEGDAAGADILSRSWTKLRAAAGLPRLNRRTIAAGLALIAGVLVILGSVLGAADSSKPNSHAPGRLTASIAGRASASRPQRDLRFGKPAVANRPTSEGRSRATARPHAARQAARAHAFAPATSTSRSGSSSPGSGGTLASSGASSPTYVAQQPPAAPQPSYQSARASPAAGTGSAPSGAQSGGAFTLGGP